MWEIIVAAGWPIWPLIIASVVALAIIGERAFALRESTVAPPNLLPELQAWLAKGGVTKETISRLEQHSMLGQVFASALSNSNNSREVTKEAIEETGRAVAHNLDRYLSTLGTIATVAPLLGLLGTVIGMVELFGAFTSTGHDIAQFARGISVALYNTAAGIEFRSTRYCTSVEICCNNLYVFTSRKHSPSVPTTTKRSIKYNVAIL